MFNYRHPGPPREEPRGLNCRPRTVSTESVGSASEFREPCWQTPRGFILKAPSIHFGIFARKMDPGISENGPQNHPKVNLRPCHTQARGQSNLEVQNGPPSRCFLVVTCTIRLRFPFWRRGSDRVAAARLFQGSKPSKIVPPRSTFRRSKLSKIVPKRSTVHRPKLFL